MSWLLTKKWHLQCSVMNDSWAKITYKVHKTEQWSVKSHISFCWSLGQWCLVVSVQFQLPNEEGGHAISANKFRSPGNMKLISSQIFARRCCQEAQRARGWWETALSRPLCLLNTRGSPDTHKSIMEEAPNQMSSVCGWDSSGQMFFAVLLYYTIVSTSLKALCHLKFCL